MDETVTINPLFCSLCGGLRNVMLPNSALPPSAEDTGYEYNCNECSKSRAIPSVFLHKGKKWWQCATTALRNLELLHYKKHFRISTEIFPFVKSHLIALMPELKLHPLSERTLRQNLNGGIKRAILLGYIETIGEGSDARYGLVKTTVKKEEDSDYCFSEDELTIDAIIDKRRIKKENEKLGKSKNQNKKSKLSEDSENESDESGEEDYNENKTVYKPEEWEYLVKWSGYDESYNEWVPYESLKCPGLLENFEKEWKLKQTTKEKPLPKQAKKEEPKDSTKLAIIPTPLPLSYVWVDGIKIISHENQINVAANKDFNFNKFLEPTYGKCHKCKLDREEIVVSNSEAQFVVCKMKEIHSMEFLCKKEWCYECLSELRYMAPNSTERQQHKQLQQNRKRKGKGKCVRNRVNLNDDTIWDTSSPYWVCPACIDLCNCRKCTLRNQSHPQLKVDLASYIFNLKSSLRKEIKEETKRETKSDETKENYETGESDNNNNSESESESEKEGKESKKERTIDNIRRSTRLQVQYMKKIVKSKPNSSFVSPNDSNDNIEEGYESDEIYSIVSPRKKVAISPEISKAPTTNNLKYLDFDKSPNSASPTDNSDTLSKSPKSLVSSPPKTPQSLSSFLELMPSRPAILDYADKLDCVTNVLFMMENSLVYCGFVEIALNKTVSELRNIITTEEAVPNIEAMRFLFGLAPLSKKQEEKKRVIDCAVSRQEGVVVVLRQNPSEELIEQSPTHSVSSSLWI